MKFRPINEATKQSVRERAEYLCEYCHSLELLSANRFTIDHIVPRSLGGSDDIDNLALACRRCNERRYNFVAGIDPETQEIVPIFKLICPIYYWKRWAVPTPEYKYSNHDCW